ncbi:unnamed protein product, partial [Meganyctiphanes norvegica]
MSAIVDKEKIQNDYLTMQDPVRNYKKYIRCERMWGLLVTLVMLCCIRSNDDTCNVPPVMWVKSKTCRCKSSMIDEEKGDYDIGWKELPSDSRPRKGKGYNYEGSITLKGVPVMGKIDTYGGGGYEVKIPKSRDSFLREIDRLEKERWIDARTRAIFVEFSLYNVQVNLFSSCRIIMEQGPEGTLHPYIKFKPLKLLRYHEGFGLFVVICEAIFIVFIIYYTYQIFKYMCRDKKKYFDDPWNYLEIIVVVLGWTAIVFYGIRTTLGVLLANKFAEANGKGNLYIKLDYEASVDEVFGYLVSFLVFFATLKFIKILKFNKRMGMLTSTLKQVASDLSGFMIAFFICFFSFAHLFFLLHNPNHLDYTSIISSIEASLSALLGKFDYEGISESSPVLGTLSFFVFAFFTSIVMVNLLLTLVIRGFQEISHNLQKQSNEYEIVDFMFNRVRLALGLKPKITPIGPLNPTVDELEMGGENKEELTEKVDQLLNYINSFYFDSKLNLNDKEWLKQIAQIYIDTHKKTYICKYSIKDQGILFGQ